MRVIRAHAGFALVLGGALALSIWLFGFGGATQISQWAAGQQRDVQGALAGALRAVRSGDVWAWGSLLGLCFAYGFFHAAGPGHGKLVMGGYALSAGAPRRRLIALTLGGSLGQAVTAIVLVYTGVLVLGWGRTQMTDLADGALAAFSAGAIVLVGLWLVVRGARRWRRSLVQAEAVCGSCGHAHGPTAEQVETVQDWRDGLAVVGAVAIRPCTGALFVLIVTYGMGIPLAGVMGALVMGLGTAVLTVAVALGAGHLRGGLVERLDGPSGVRVMALVEMLAGLLVALIAGQMVLRLL